MAKSTLARHNARPIRTQGGSNVKGLVFFGIIIAVFVAIAGLLIVVSRQREATGDAPAEAMNGPAPDFTLPSLDGTNFSLASYKGQKNVLLFFNEGYGCAPCWQQSAEMQKRLEEINATDTEYLPIVVDPARLARDEYNRYGLTVPVLINEDASVAKAYQTLGFGMHASKPNHTFVFIDKSGTIRWWQDYASMSAPTDDVIAKVKELSVEFGGTSADGATAQ
jgi:peroxiredoxin